MKHSFYDVKTKSKVETEVTEKVTYEAAGTTRQRGSTALFYFMPVSRQSNLASTDRTKIGLFLLKLLNKSRRECMLF